MSDKTTNYGLTKPLSTDYYDIEIQNGNMEILDAQLKALNSDKEGLIKDAASKASLVDADTIPLTDSAASNSTKKITLANLKATLKSYFDTLYNKYVHPTYTARSAGIYKLSVDDTGHVNGVTNVVKSDITALGIPGQDTVTEVVDNLTSAESGKALSAKQGKVLNELVSAISNEVDSLDASKIELTNATATKYGLSGTEANVDKTLDVLAKTTLLSDTTENLYRALCGVTGDNITSDDLFAAIPRYLSATPREKTLICTLKLHDTIDNIDTLFTNESVSYYENNVLKGTTVTDTSGKAIIPISSTAATFKFISTKKVLLYGDGVTFNVAAITKINESFYYAESVTNSLSLQSIITSGEFEVPNYLKTKTIDLFCVGGGGSGGSGTSYGGGGGGGRTGTLKNRSLSGVNVVKFNIGAGGAALASTVRTDIQGNRGSETSIQFNSTYQMYAYGGDGGGSSGGSGGSGGGQSSYSYSQTDTIPFAGGTDGGSSSGSGQGSTTRAFGEAAGTLYSGGGGGAHWVAYDYDSTVWKGGFAGGEGGGGRGSFKWYEHVSGGGVRETGFSGRDATNYGGGGGGILYPSYSEIYSGAGYQGIVLVRRSV